MSRRQGRISNRDNAKVGAGGRQRGYHKAGRVKKAGSKWSESRVRTVMKNLEKSWNFKTAISRPGKVLEK